MKKGLSLRFGFLQLISGVVIFVTAAEETVSNMLFTSPRLGRLNSFYKSPGGDRIGIKIRETFIFSDLLLEA